MHLSFSSSHGCCFRGFFVVTEPKEPWMSDPWFCHIFDVKGICHDGRRIDTAAHRGVCTTSRAPPCLIPAWHTSEEKTTPAECLVISPSNANSGQCALPAGGHLVCVDDARSPGIHSPVWNRHGCHQR